MNRKHVLVGAVMALAALAAANSVEAQTFGQHPALRGAQPPTAGIDPNTFIVQPPASVHWALASEPPAQLASNR